MRTKRRKIAKKKQRRDYLPVLSFPMFEVRKKFAQLSLILTGVASPPLLYSPRMDTTLLYKLSGRCSLLVYETCLLVMGQVRELN